jgi:hypothetical protein
MKVFLDCAPVVSSFHVRRCDQAADGWSGQARSKVIHRLRSRRRGVHPSPSAMAVRSVGPVDCRWSIGPIPFQVHDHERSRRGWWRRSGGSSASDPSDHQFK